MRTLRKDLRCEKLTFFSRILRKRSIRLHQSPVTAGAKGYPFSLPYLGLIALSGWEVVVDT